MSTSFLLAVSERTNDSHNINTHVGSTDIVRGVLSEINGRAMVETVVSVSSDAQAGLLNVESLGTSLPSNAMHGADETSRPFACAVRIEIRGQTESQAVEQGSALVREVQSWIDLLQLAREDGGIDVKDDCRIEDCSARCHQDGNNSVKPGRFPALIRLAINVSSLNSGRSLDYLDMSSNERLIDGDERATLLLHSVSQDRIWHGAAQTIAGYVQGVTQVCHGSSAGTGPCLKRIFTVFPLPKGHPLASLTAVQRLQRIGVSVHALAPRHML